MTRLCLISRYSVLLQVSREVYHLSGSQMAVSRPYEVEAKSKPENLTISIEPHIDRTPRALLIPTPYEEQIKSLNPSCSCVNNINLNCTLSRPVQIRTILVHVFNDHHLFKHNLTITLSQNGKELLNFAGEHAIMRWSDGTPRHFAVKAKDVGVEAGALQVDIQLRSTNIMGIKLYYDIHFSPQTASKLSDNFV